MIRRSPTRIELKLDDLQEYESAKGKIDRKKEEEVKKIKVKIHERIGLVRATPDNN